MKNRTGELREAIADEMEYWVTKQWIVAKTNRDTMLYYSDQILKACKEKGLAFVVDRRVSQCWLAYIHNEECPRVGYKSIEEIEIEENATKKNTD